MAAHKKVFDEVAVGKAAVQAINTLHKNETRATVESVVVQMQEDGSDIAPTRLALLLKKLSDSNGLEGFYLRRGSGFVHEDSVPRPKRKRNTKKVAKKARKAKALSADALAAEIDAQEREAALEEYRAARRDHHRKVLGLTG